MVFCKVKHLSNFLYRVKLNCKIKFTLLNSAEGNLTGQKVEAKNKKTKK